MARQTIEQRIAAAVEQALAAYKAQASSSEPAGEDKPARVKRPAVVTARRNAKAELKRVKALHGHNSPEANRARLAYVKARKADAEFVAACEAAGRPINPFAGMQADGSLANQRADSTGEREATKTTQANGTRTKRVKAAEQKSPRKGKPQARTDKPAWVPSESMCEADGVKLANRMGTDQAVDEWLAGQRAKFEAGTIKDSTLAQNEIVAKVAHREIGRRVAAKAAARKGRR